jgi:hypothetical protein
MIAVFNTLVNGLPGQRRGRAQGVINAILWTVDWPL